MKVNNIFSLFNRAIILMVVCLLLSDLHLHAQNTAEAAPAGSSGAVALLTRYEVKQEGTKKLRKMLAKYVKQVGRSEGNIMAEAYYEQDSDHILWVIERWATQGTLEQNKQGAVYRKIRRLLEKKLAAPERALYVKDLEPLSKSDWRRAPDKADKPFTVMLFVDCKAGTEEQFTTVYHAAMPQFRSEPGVVNYQLSQLQDDRTQFVTYEKFRNDEAFQYHLHFPPIQPVLNYLNASIKKQPFQLGLHRLIAFATVQ